MKPIPIIKKELDRNGVIGFLSITKEKLSNFFNRTFIDPADLAEQKKRKRKSRTTRNSRRAILDSHPVNSKIVKAKAKHKLAKAKSKVQINGAIQQNGNNHIEAEKKPEKTVVTNGHLSPVKSTNHAKKRRSESPEKKISTSDLKSSSKDDDQADQANKKSEKKTKIKTDRSKGVFNEDRHRKICLTKCNVTNFDDLNELQLELERRLSVIEKYKQTLEFERIRLEKATDISNFLISKPKAKFAKLRSIVLGHDSDWDAQLRPPPRIKNSQRCVRKAIQQAHNSFTPLYSLTLSTKAALNYLLSPKIVTKLTSDSVEHLKKIYKNFNRLSPNNESITPLYKPIFTETQLEFIEFVKQFAETNLNDIHSAMTIIQSWKDFIELYRSLLPSVPLNNLDDFKCLLQTLTIRTKSDVPASNLKVLKEELHGELSLKKKYRQNNGSSSILRQLLSTPPKVSPNHSVSTAPLNGDAAQTELYRSGSEGSSSNDSKTSNSLLVELNFAQLDDLRRRTSVLLGRIRDFAHEFASETVSSEQTLEQSQTIFSNICADIDSTAKMCSFMNGNLPIFTSNCLGCEPLPSKPSPSSAHRSCSAPSSASSSYLSSFSPCSTPLWASSTSSSQSSSSTMSIFSSSVSVGAAAAASSPASSLSLSATPPLSGRMRLMRYCGELCGALSPEPIEPMEAVEYTRPKKWKWRSKKRSSPKKSRRRKPQSELIRKRRSQVSFRHTDDDTEIEDDDDDIGLRFEDFDEIELVERDDIVLKPAELDEPDLDVFIESFNMRSNFLEIVDDCCDGDSTSTRLVPPFMYENNSSHKRFNNNNKTINETSTMVMTVPSVNQTLGSPPVTKIKRKMYNGNSAGGGAETKLKMTTLETKTATITASSSLTSANIVPTDSLDSVICRLVEHDLIPLMQQNARQIELLNSRLNNELTRQMNLTKLREDYVKLLDTIYKYLIKNRAILKRDSDILCQSLDRFIQLSTELQEPESWIVPEDYGEDFFESVFFDDQLDFIYDDNDNVSLSNSVQPQQTAEQYDCSYEQTHSKSTNNLGIN